MPGHAPSRDRVAVIAEEVHHRHTLAAAELADKAARSLDAAYARGPALTVEERVRAAIELATANAYGGEVGLAAPGGVFEAMGARSATRAAALSMRRRPRRRMTVN